MDEFINKAKIRVGLKHEEPPQVTPQEVKTRLTIANKRLTDQEKILQNQQAQYRDEAKNSLRRGDDRGYKSASRRHAMAHTQLNTVVNMADMSSAMLDAIEMQGNLKTIVGIGQDLSTLQDQMGLGSPEIEQAVTQIRSTMEAVTHASSTMTTTMDAALNSDTSFVADESLKAELMAEIQSEGSVTEFGDKIRQELSE